MKTFYITAGNHSTDLGIVGNCDTLIGAKRIGRKAVRTMLPNGEGTYYLHNRHVTGQRWGETCGLHTKFSWVSVS